MSCLCLLTVGDLMRLAISGEKLLEMGTRREARTRGAWPFSLAPSSESCYALPFGKRVAARDFQQDCVVGSKLSWTLEISEIWNTFLSWPSSEPPFPHVGGYVSCVKGGFCWMPASEVDCQVKFWWTPFSKRFTITKRRVALWGSKKDKGQKSIQSLKNPVGYSSSIIYNHLLSVMLVIWFQRIEIFVMSSIFEINPFQSLKSVNQFGCLTSRN